MSEEVYLTPPERKRLAGRLHRLAERWTAPQPQATSPEDFALRQGEARRIQKLADDLAKVEVKVGELEDWELMACGSVLDAERDLATMSKLMEEGNERGLSFQDFGLGPVKQRLRSL